MPDYLYPISKISALSNGIIREEKQTMTLCLKLASQKGERYLSTT